ncbi:MAG: hypothetical protein PGN23_09335 [Sphingomonas adhaesiva]|uniref:hypothetical protein n=1 Tax=Sphingomonas adhaesiva TaxID=28212 RepID=UPI002FFBFE14
MASVPLLLAAACSGGGDPTPGLTADQDRQLNEAAEMLDANSVALEQVTDNVTENGS